MAKDYIKIDTTTNGALQAPLLKQYIAVLRQAYELGNRVKAIMTHNNDGSDFTPIEGLFGLPVNKGQTVFDLVNGSVGSMEGSFQVDDVKQLTEQVG